jgi:hypothetical protein
MTILDIILTGQKWNTGTLEQLNAGITGVMEWWNDGFQIFTQHSILPVFESPVYFFSFSFSAANSFSGVIGNSLILTPTAS